MIVIPSIFHIRGRRPDAVTRRRGEPNAARNHNLFFPASLRLRASASAFPPVTASLFTAWFAGHLKHGASGNLIHNASGNLVSACATSGNCPTVCSSCLPNYPLTVAGIGGPGPSCCIAALNGTFTLTRISNNCQWASGTQFQPGGCSFGWELFCSKVDCNNVSGPMRWVIAMYGSIGYVWAEMISNATCPPTGTYRICANLCAGGTGAMVVLG